MKWKVFIYQKMQHYTFQWFIYCVYKCNDVYIYVYVFSDLWIWNFHHSNFLLTNAFIYLHPMRLSLGKRPSQFLEHRYLLNETVFQEKKTAELQNYMACDQCYPTSIIFMLMHKLINCSKNIPKGKTTKYSKKQKAFKENIEKK